MKLFKTTHWTMSNSGSRAGISKYYVCINKQEEKEMYQNLSEYDDIIEVDINNIKSITELHGLSLVNFKKLLDNM